MKKFTSVLLAFACVFSCCFCISIFQANAVTNNSKLVMERHVTYKNDKNYTGEDNVISSHIDVGEFADLNIVEDGGNHLDGNGNQVFSNYVIFSIKLNFDPSTKYIGNTGVKVSRDTCDWNKTPYAQEGATEQYIAYGAISATRADGSGKIEHYEPIFSKGNTTIENMNFNDDGDYTIRILFETVKKGKHQNHVLEWSFKIRSYVYLIDEETKFPIKESGISSKNVVLDYASRKNIEVECTLNNEAISVNDGFVLFAKQNTQDEYKFTVKSNGFVCERFTFCIDTKNPTAQFFFENLRKQLGEYYYEAEEYFSLVWSENPSNPVTVTYDYYSYSTDKPVSAKYTSGQKLDKLGLYHVTATTKMHTIDYWIEVVAGDAPSHNYGVLSAKRFNNFKTKWYEVYDDINDRYLCFDVEEYARAYDAAMTIENTSVSASSGKYYYNGEWYSDRIDLTIAMNEYVFANNLKLVYYDPADYSEDEESERTFSSAAFDGTRYLNDDFQFVNSHYSETNSVVITDENGVSSELKFFVPISKQNISEGEYVITETDFYGNSVSYSVVRDKSAPVISLMIESSIMEVNNISEITTNEPFSIEEFYDTYDSFAVLKIVKPDSLAEYYYKDECLGIVFEEVGIYSISAYDRNGNTINFTVEIY